MQMTLSPWKNVSVDCRLGRRVWRGRDESERGEDQNHDLWFRP